MPTVSCPWTLIEPLRLPISPRIARSVLVRPAPLRPSKVTTSPSSTFRLTPCSTCDSPYQPCRSAISRKVRAISVRPLQLGVRRAHVGLDHGRVAGHLGIGTLGQRGTALQHGDRVGD